MKKIMIISSNYTGHGHKSIADSLVEQLSLYEDVEVRVVEGFALIGTLGVRASKLYGSITRTSEDLWKVMWLLTTQRSDKLDEMIALLIHDRLMKRLSEWTPDLILSVHPMFNGSVLNVLQKYGMKIPFITLLADIWDIHRSWIDMRASLILSPTDEARDICLSFGIPPERVTVTGFPTRARFCDAAKLFSKQPFDSTRPFRCLVMSGGEGSGNMLKYAKQLLSNFNCHITILAGRNKRLRERLSDSLLPRYAGRVDILGFCENVQDYMLQSDMIITRASPNTLLEAVVCNVPIIVTGNLPGQEARNPLFITKHRLGVISPSAVELPDIVIGLIEKKGEKLNEIAKNQRNYRNFDNAKNIAAIAYENAAPLEADFPQYKPLIPNLRTAKAAVKRINRRIRLTRRKMGRSLNRRKSGKNRYF